MFDSRPIGLRPTLSMTLPLASLLLLLCASGCKKDAAPAATPSAESPATETAVPNGEKPAGESDKPADNGPLRVNLGMLDTTTEAERPADMTAHFMPIIESAARKAGFELADDGHRGGLAFYYALVEDGKINPKADRGTIVWGVQAELVVKDADLLKTTYEGVGRGEAPFVRGALPELDKAFRQLLEEAAVTALRDIDMQIRYEDADAKTAVKALSSRHPEEVWAGLRRLGELGAKDQVEAIVGAFEAGDKPTKVIAGGVLIRLGDRRAIPRLTEVGMHETDPPTVIFIASVIEQLGGDEAPAALAKLREKHPEAPVREALERVVNPKAGNPSAGEPE